jgi:hypothetical protein
LYSSRVNERPFKLTEGRTAIQLRIEVTYKKNLEDNSGRRSAEARSRVATFIYCLNGGDN